MATEQQITDLSNAVHQQGESITELKDAMSSLKSVVNNLDSKMNRILYLLGIYLHQPSNMEEYTISIEDFTVSSSEEIKSTPPDVDAEMDPLELKLIPSFFFVEREDGTLTKLLYLLRTISTDQSHGYIELPSSSSHQDYSMDI
ncbi:uncharacterized protein LOC113321684 [Papaver somniferum]|uniref:uncharacterized protein LOC113321684 n=1 Tax=Papaver somniferum TaxID=3469 RepID=UPI000E6FEAE0|nr:uncharacterized protein LOC113321684 [Papaver somniferum]